MALKFPLKRAKPSSSEVVDEQPADSDQQADDGAPTKQSKSASSGKRNFRMPGVPKLSKADKADKAEQNEGKHGQLDSLKEKINIPKITLPALSLQSIKQKSESHTPATSKKKKKRLPKTKSRSCFVLMIGDEGGILTYMEKGRVIRRLFAPSAEKQHIKPFLELMNANAKAPLYVLCDMIDQSYVRHTLPPVSPLSIKKLVNRRLKRDFSPEDITGSISLGREKEGRKEWNFMLISLANSAALQQWLEPVLEAPNRTMGLFLLPVEAQGFIDNLSISLRVSEGAEDSIWKILVSHDKVGGIRQTVLQEGRLVFTRLTQIPGDISPEVLAGNIEQEVQNTIEYLRRMSFDPEAGLDVFIIVAQEVRDLIEPQKIHATQVKSFSPLEAAKLLGLNQAALSGDRFSDVVLSANFGMRQRQHLKLLPGYMKKLDQIYQARMGIKIAGSLTILYLIYTASMNVLNWIEASGSQTDLQQKLTVAKQELERTEKRFKSLGDDQTNIMRVSALKRDIPSQAMEPVEFVERLGQAKDAGMKVANWSWKPVENPKDLEKFPEDIPPLEKGGPQYVISATVEILDHNGDTRVLAKNVKTLMKDLEANLDDFFIMRSQLPEEKKTEEEKKVVIDLNAPAEDPTYELKPGEQFITLTFAGPVKKNKKAQL